MNERLKQLKIQACKWANENASSAEYENAADQKFAQLIVKECVDIADETALGDTTYGWMVGNKIKEHFGVEE